MTNAYREIPISQIIPAHSMLRPVREEYLEYIEMVDSIRANGLMNSLLVRPHPLRGGVYEIIDGMWRFIACRELDISTIPCIIKLDNLTEEEFLQLQVQANAVSYETRPIEFAEQMQRMLQLRESAGAPMNIAELARAVSKSAAWVTQRLKLLHLCDLAQDMIRRGTLGLTKGVILARIHNHKYQIAFLEKAATLKVREFEMEVGQFISLKREEKSSGRRNERNKITLMPRLQSMDSMLIELDRLQNVGQIIVKKGLTTALEGARIALEWVLNLHEEGRQAQVKEIRHKLSSTERQAVIGKQRYEELKQLRELSEQKRDPFSTLPKDKESEDTDYE